MTTFEETSLELPSILPDIYRASSTLGAIKNHMKTLKKHSSNRNAKLLLNEFEEYYKLLSNQTIFNTNRRFFNKIHQNTVKNHPEYFIKTTARVKGLVSLYDKCRIKLYDGISLDTIKDIYACRTIIDSRYGDSEKLLKLCYQIMDETINLMISLGLTPCEKEEEKDTDSFKKEKFPNILVPKRSYLSKENQKYVKDYLLHPKGTNGYQSLHVIFRGKNGKYFEYQVRTYSMDFYAEHGNASHLEFKDNQKKEKNISKLVIDRTKIKIPGYRFVDNIVSDDAGIEKSVPILLRTYRAK